MWIIKVPKSYDLGFPICEGIYNQKSKKKKMGCNWVGRSHAQDIKWVCFLLSCGLFEGRDKRKKKRWGFIYLFVVRICRWQRSSNLCLVSWKKCKTFVWGIITCLLQLLSFFEFLMTPTDDRVFDVKTWGVLHFLLQ